MSKPFSKVAAMFVAQALDIAGKTGASINLSEVASRIGTALAGLQRYNQKRNAERRLVRATSARRVRRAKSFLKREARA